MPSQNHTNHLIKLQTCPILPFFFLVLNDVSITAWFVTHWKYSISLQRSFAFMGIIKMFLVKTVPYFLELQEICGNNRFKHFLSLCSSIHLGISLNILCLQPYNSMPLLFSATLALFNFWPYNKMKRFKRLPMWFMEQEDYKSQQLIISLIEA